MKTKKEHLSWLQESITMITVHFLSLSFHQNAISWENHKKATTRFNLYRSLHKLRYRDIHSKTRFVVKSSSTFVSHMISHVLLLRPWFQEWTSDLKESKTAQDRQPLLMTRDLVQVINKTDENILNSKKSIDRWQESRNNIQCAWITSRWHLHHQRETWWWVGNETNFLSFHFSCRHAKETLDTSSSQSRVMILRLCFSSQRSVCNFKAICHSIQNDMFPFFANDTSSLI